MSDSVLEEMSRAVERIVGGAVAADPLLENDAQRLISVSIDIVNCGPLNFIQACAVSLALHYAYSLGARHATERWSLTDHDDGINLADEIGEALAPKLKTKKE